MIARLFFVCMTVLWVSSSQQPVFRARSEAVTVTVSVKAGNNPVLGLAAKDFVVDDNGVTQNVISVSLEEVPIDVTLVLDTSGSTAFALEDMNASAKGIAAGLRARDRFRVLTIGNSVYEALPWTDAGIPFSPVMSFTSGVSLVYDAMLAAMRHVTAAGRRHVVIALTDGLDCGSVVSPDVLVEVAKRSDAVVHWVSVENHGGSRPKVRGAIARCFPDHRPADPRILTSVAEQTGGAQHSSLFGVDPVKVFSEILSDFRQSYVLSFVPEGTEPQGWHVLQVRVPGAKYVVHARPGYSRSPKALAAEERF